MLYEFRSRATGSVTMISKAAEQVLKIIGKSPDATGIITVAQIPAAIAALEQAAEREQPPADQPQDADDQNLQEDARERFVSLRQRVYPLIELMREGCGRGRDLGRLSAVPLATAGGGTTSMPCAHNAS